MAQPQKETTLGNYTSFPRFPLDCESMDYIQNNTKLLAVIAQIAGCDKLIIKGCTGSPRTEGYVYVRTGDDLVGEILYYGGGTGVRCSIATDNINIDTTANGETFANAYTKRMLVSGTTGTWAWSDFRALSEITNSALKTLVDGKAAASHTHPIGNITGLQSALDGKAATSHIHSIGNISGLQSALDGKSNVGHTHNYSAPGHGHSISEVYNLQSALNDKSDVGHTHNYSAPGHTHDDRYYTEAEVRQLISDSVPKYESITADHGVTVYKFGRVATMVISNMTISPNSTNSYVTSLSGYGKWQPINTILGVGINTSSENSLDNLLYFQVTGPTIKVFNRTNRTSLWGSITYITKE